VLLVEGLLVATLSQRVELVDASEGAIPRQASGAAVEVVCGRVQPGRYFLDERREVRQLLRSP
jgi:hypothetical protein